MSFLLQFAPWITFTVLASATDWRIGIVAGLVAQLILLVAVKPHRLGIINGAMVVFFVVAGVFAFLRPDSGLQDQIAVLATAWLAVVAFGSVAIGRPFTEDISRSTVTPEIAATALFHRINATISLVWASVFAASAVLSVILVAAERPALNTIVHIGLLVYAIKFSMSYPDKAAGRARPAATAGASR